MSGRSSRSAHPSMTGSTETSRPSPRKAKRGFALFNTKAQCSSCHEGWNFTNDGFQDIGLPSDDVGRGKFVPGVVKMQHAFKTPGLREITRRSPYMHDGSLATPIITTRAALSGRAAPT